uniref:RING-type E3 ubiquitin transferase n=1 Tax=Salix viminalis TaxID=40686 RepID=A0A6N2LFU5_SALVM
MSTTFSTPPLPFQHFHGDFHLRKLLLHNPLSPLPSSNAQDPLNPNATGVKSFNINVFVVFIVLMGALLSSIGLNSFIRCALRCSYLNGSSANRGIKKKALKTFPVVNYSVKDSKLPGLDTECVICISEFVRDDRVRILPKCSHVFHVSCIDEWLSSHSSCPTCRHCLVETCRKIAGASPASSSEQPPSLIQERVVNIAPLEREGVVSNYRGGVIS